MVETSAQEAGASQPGATSLSAGARDWFPFPFLRHLGDSHTLQRPLRCSPSFLSTVKSPRPLPPDNLMPSMWPHRVHQTSECHLWEYQPCFPELSWVPVSPGLTNYLNKKQKQNLTSNTVS